MKNFIMDDNKVRNCAHNKAQMNLFEFFKYFPEYFIKPLKNYIDSLGDVGRAIKDIAIFTLLTILMIFYPIGLIILGCRAIKKAKEEKKKFDKLQNARNDINKGELK